ncbi:MAG: hypothetical protein JRI36_13640 [Deltaproteobacteria bacterium]|nr:hypothetical protein [Deltaproteobacteria bacterium]
MALDEPQGDDEVMTDDGVTFMMNSQLLMLAKPIHVDYITNHEGSGFVVSSSILEPSSCGSPIRC